MGLVKTLMLLKTGITKVNIRSYWTWLWRCRDRQLSYGEKIVNAPNAGAIGFISTSSLGKIPYINNFAEVFYEQVSPYYYGQTVGQQMYKL